MNPITIPQDWQGAIERLRNLPDKSWRSDCQTFEQVQRWDECKALCWFVGRLLKDYFSGVSSDALAQMPKKDQDFWRLYRDRWIQLYGLIQDSWIEIRQEIIKSDLEGNFPDQPGAMLLAMLESWANGLFAPCVIEVHPELGRFSPRKAYTNYGGQFKPIRPKTLNECRKRFSQADLEMMAFNAEEIFCLLVCEKLAKTDRQFKRKLKNFREIEFEVDQTLYAQIHPRKKIQGHQWIDGSKHLAV